MSETFNLYCDESCHLENDRLRVMVLGVVPAGEVAWDLNADQGDQGEAWHETGL